MRETKKKDGSLRQWYYDAIAISIGNSGTLSIPEYQFGDLEIFFAMMNGVYKKRTKPWKIKHKS